MTEFGTPTSESPKFVMVPAVLGSEKASGSWGGGGIGLTTGYWPDGLRKGLQRYFTHFAARLGLDPGPPFPEPVPIGFMVDGTHFGGEQMTAEGVRVAAAFVTSWGWDGHRLMYVEMAHWDGDGPLELAIMPVTSSLPTTQEGPGDPADHPGPGV